MMIVPGSAFIPKGCGDPYWSNVMLLMHFDDNVNDATGRHSPTSFGVTYENGTFDKRVICNAGDTIDVPASADFADDDVFTIEFKIISTTAAPNVWFFNATHQAGTGVGLYHFALNSGGVAGQLTFSHNITPGPTNIFAIGTLGSGTEHSVAVTLNASGVLNGYLDGVKSANSVQTSAHLSTPQKLEIATSSYFGGSVGFKMDELRITKGVVRYIGDYTPAITPFPD